MVVEVFKLESSPVNAFFEGQRLVRYEIIADLDQLLRVRSAVLERGLDIVGFGQVRVYALYRLDK